MAPGVPKRLDFGTSLVILAIILVHVSLDQVPSICWAIVSPVRPTLGVPDPLASLPGVFNRRDPPRRVKLYRD